MFDINSIFVVNVVMFWKGSEEEVWQLVERWADSVAAASPALLRTVRYARMDPQYFRHLEK